MPEVEAAQALEIKEMKEIVDEIEIEAGAKADLEGEREVSEEKATAFCKQNDMQYYESSAKQG